MQSGQITYRKRRQKRSYLKRFSADVVHIKSKGAERAPEEGVTKQGGEPANRYYTFAPKARSKAAQQVFENPGLHNIDGNYLKLWQGTRRQGLETFNHIVFEEGRHYCILYYFSGNEHFIIEIKNLANTIRRSIIYRSRSLLLQAVELGSVIWDETQKLSPASPPQSQGIPQP